MIFREQRIGTALLLIGAASGSLSDLHPIERACLRPRANAKRRDDFIAGRLLAKEALRRAFGEGEWIIDRAVGVHEGAPMVCGPHPACLSLSHVDGIVAVVVSAGEVAVDLVKEEPFSEALCEETFTRNERSAWRGAEATAFAAKEAALKWLKTGMGTALQAIEVLPSGDGAVTVRTAANSTTLACATFTHREWLSFVLFERGES